MPRVEIQLVTRVPLFSEIEIDAKDRDEALKIAERMREYGDTLGLFLKLSWMHGEGAEHPITFPLDERDFDCIEVQDVIERP
jgi:hypothetical protein